MSLLSRVMAVLYNLDRAIASAAGASPQETISSEAGEALAKGKWWGRSLCWVLENPLRFLFGKDHCARAIQHAEKLDKVDIGEIGRASCRERV